MKRTTLTALALVAVLSPGTAWAQEATPSPSPSEPPPSCPAYKVETHETPLENGAHGVHLEVKVISEAPAPITIRRRLPEPQAVVRSAPEATTAFFGFNFGENHTLDVEVGTRCGRPATPVFVTVRPTVTIAAVRNAPRDYTFSGRVLPAKGQAVALYRHTAEGARVLTAHGTVRPDGTYRIDRRFTGSGRFGFSVAVKESTAHLAGSSSVRPTVIH